MSTPISVRFPPKGNIFAGNSDHPRAIPGPCECCGERPRLPSHLGCGLCYNQYLKDENDKKKFACNWPTWVATMGPSRRADERAACPTCTPNILCDRHAEEADAKRETEILEKAMSAPQDPSLPLGYGRGLLDRIPAEDYNFMMDRAEKRKRAMKSAPIHYDRAFTSGTYIPLADVLAQIQKASKPPASEKLNRIPDFPANVDLASAVRMDPELGPALTKFIEESKAQDCEVITPPEEIAGPKVVHHKNCHTCTAVFDLRERGWTLLHARYFCPDCSPAAVDLHDKMVDFFRTESETLRPAKRAVLEERHIGELGGMELTKDAAPARQAERDAIILREARAAVGRAMKEWPTCPVHGTLEIAAVHLDKDTGKSIVLLTKDNCTPPGKFPNPCATSQKVLLATLSPRARRAAGAEWIAPKWRRA